MLMPKKVKYRKQQRGRRKGKAWRGGSLAFGEYGLKAMENAWITDRQIEASRVAITRYIKRGGKLWIRIFPDSLKRKEVKTMNYTKPEIAVLGPAVVTIQGSRINSGDSSSDLQQTVTDCEMDD